MACYEMPKSLSRLLARTSSFAKKRLATEPYAVCIGRTMPSILLNTLSQMYLHNNHMAVRGCSHRERTPNEFSRLHLSVLAYAVAVQINLQEHASWPCIEQLQW